MKFAGVVLNPSPGNLPGSQELQKFANGLAGWALIAALIALVIGAALWAFGSHAQNMQQSMAGRRAVITSILAALLIGGAPALINFFFTAGQAIKK